MTNPQQPKLIVFDVDGTLVDFIGGFMRFMKTKGIETDRTHAHISRHNQFIEHLYPELRDFNLDELISEFGDHPEFMRLDALSGAREAITALRHHYPDARLIAVSSIAADTPMSVRRAEQLIPFGLDDYIPAGLHALKAPLLQKLGADVLFDDYEGQIIAANEAGIHAVLVDQPWNRHHEATHRLTCWSQARELIERR